jgi:hypothetical protein
MRTSNNVNKGEGQCGASIETPSHPTTSIRNQEKASSSF